MSNSSKIQFISFFLLTVLLIAVQSSQFNPLLLPSDLAHNNNNGGYDDHLCPRVSEPAPDSCPVKCFRTDPVCGVDGVTYWCGCADAHCAGTRVAKLGFCEVGNGGSGSVSGQALLLVHIVWLILLGIFVLFGLLWIGWLFYGFFLFPPFRGCNWFDFWREGVLTLVIFVCYIANEFADVSLYMCVSRRDVEGLMFPRS